LQEKRYLSRGWEQINLQALTASKTIQAHAFVFYFSLQLTLKANEPAPVPGSDGGGNGQELRIFPARFDPAKDFNEKTQKNIVNK